MGPKTRQMNTRYRVKQTSTPLNEGYVIQSFPSMKSISTVKVLRKRTIILPRESPCTLKNRSKQVNPTSRRSEQKFSIASKKYNSRPRRDTPLKPMGSFITRMSSGSPKRLKFSQISDTLDKPNSFKNEDCSSPFGDEAPDYHSEITGEPTESTIDGKNVPKDTWSTLTTSESTDELDDIKMSGKTSNLQAYSVLRGNISSANTKQLLQTRVVSELTMDTSSSVETCRRQSSSLLLPPSLNFSLSGDVLSGENVGDNLEKDINITPLSTHSKDTKNQSVTKFETFLENIATSWDEIRVDGDIANEVDYTSNYVSTIPFASEIHFKKNTASNDAQKVEILDAKDENTKVSTSDGNSGDHLQLKAAMVDIHTEKKNCNRNVDIVPLAKTSERKSSGSRDSVSGFGLADSERKSKEVFKPLPTKKNKAKKSRDSKYKAKNVRSPSLKPYSRKKDGEVFSKPTSWNEIPIDGGHANVVDDANNFVVTIPYPRHDTGVLMEKKTPLCVPQKAQILDAEDENTKATDSDGKFCDHLQHNETMVGIQTKRKKCKGNADIVPLIITPERKSKAQDSVSDSVLADLKTKSKDVSKKPLLAEKNNAKKKLRDRKKKAKDVKSPSLKPYNRKKCNKVSVKSTIGKKIPIDGGNASVVDVASNCVATIRYESLDSELRLEKNTLSCDPQKARILEAKYESTNMTVSDGKFGDHLRHNATVVDIQTKRKHTKRRADIKPLSKFSRKKLRESQDSVKNFSLADSGRKIKGTFEKPLSVTKNNTKKKSRANQKKAKDFRSPSLKPCTRKKSREIKKRNGKISHPSTSTPLISSNVAIKRFAAPLEHISPLGTLEENVLKGHYEVDDLHFKGTQTCKIYGRRKSELSRRWDSFLRKDPNYSKIAEENCEEESPKLKRVLPRKQRLLFLTPPSYSLDEIPIDDIVKCKYESKKTSCINETDETSIKWNECTKIRQLILTTWQKILQRNQNFAM